MRGLRQDCGLPPLYSIFTQVNPAVLLNNNVPVNCSVRRDLVLLRYDKSAKGIFFHSSKLRVQYKLKQIKGIWKERANVMIENKILEQASSSVHEAISLTNRIKMCITSSNYIHIYKVLNCIIKF